MPLRKYDQRVGEYPDHDRGHAIQKIRNVPHYEGKRRSTEFREVNSAQESDWYADAGRQQQKLSATEECIGHAAARFADRGWQLGKEIPSQAGAAVEE